MSALHFNVCISYVVYILLLFFWNKRWTGGGRGTRAGRGGVPVVMIDSNLDQLESALGVVDRAGNVDTSDVRDEKYFLNIYIFPGFIVITNMKKS